MNEHVANEGLCPASKSATPFDVSRLDAAMEEMGLDVLLVNSKHNIQYLTGGYRFFFFDLMDAVGVSRYLPILIYQRGKPDDALYLGCKNEADALRVRALVDEGFWPKQREACTWTTIDATQAAIDRLKGIGNGKMRVGIEAAFLPADAYQMLIAAFPDWEFIDAFRPLEFLRAVKTERELGYLRSASESVVSAMLATIDQVRPGHTSQEVCDILRREELARGLSFDYCLIGAGSHLGRAPSPYVLKEGDIFSLDSGGNQHGYIGDLCRMAILGEPDAELIDCLEQVDEVQQAARSAAGPGIPGSEIYRAAEAAMDRLSLGSKFHFVAHGMGLVSHEAPRLTDTGPIPYPASDVDTPMEPGIVLSIETTLPHEQRGMIKLEDTIAITQDGHVGFGDDGRGWNRPRSSRPFAEETQ